MLSIFYMIFYISYSYESNLTYLTIFRTEATVKYVIKNNPKKPSNPDNKQPQYS